MLEPDRLVTPDAARRLKAIEEFTMLGAGFKIALRDLAAGERLLGATLRDAVQRGHKFALADLAAGDVVVKYGQPIGRASRAIAAGDHVHSHNLTTALVIGASSGIGEAITYAFAKRGARLIISARRVEELARVKAQCLHPDRVRIIPMDLSHVNELAGKVA